MSDDIDLHIGRRLRRRRRLLGLTQQQLGDSVGIRFQQIQKYECGANRVSAAQLWNIADALQSPIAYFYEGLNDVGAADRSEIKDTDRRATMTHRETAALLSAYYGLNERPRRRFLDLAKAIGGDSDVATG